MFWYLIYFVGLLCFLHIVFNHNAKARVIRSLPGPKDSFLFGHILALLSLSSVGVIELAREMAQKSKGIYGIWTYPFGAVNIYRPEDIELIMSNMKFHEKSEIYRILKPWLADGLLTSKGSKWQERRKILTPAFHFNILRSFSQVIESNSYRLLDTLRDFAGKPIDITPIMSEFTLNSICETAMGTQMNEVADGKSYKNAIYEMGKIFYLRFTRTYYFLDTIFNISPLARKQRGYLKIMQDFTRKVIKERRDTNNLRISTNDNIDNEMDTFAYKKKKTAMLDLLLSAEREGLIDQAGIQEEVDTFMFEGHDTTASGLTFCFMLLANNKDVQDKIFEELQEVFEGSDRPVTIEDLPKMKYLERCIKESLRLYPPVHFVSRHLSEKVTLSNYEIPEGILCHIHIYDLHRLPEIYEDPERFDPDRFLPENITSRHPYAYIPFAAGPRNCIGQKFAMMEMKIAVAQVLREFKLEPVTHPSDIRMMADLVIRNDGPIEVTFIKRH